MGLPVKFNTGIRAISINTTKQRITSAFEAFSFLTEGLLFGSPAIDQGCNSIALGETYRALLNRRVKEKLTHSQLLKVS